MAGLVRACEGDAGAGARGSGRYRGVDGPAVGIHLDGRAPGVIIKAPPGLVVYELSVSGSQCRHIISLSMVVQSQQYRSSAAPITSVAWVLQ